MDNDSLKTHELFQTSKQFGDRFLPELQGAISAIRDVQNAISFGDCEESIRSDSFEFQCMNLQYAKLAELCADLCEAFTRSDGAMMSFDLNADNRTSSLNSKLDEIADIRIFQAEEVIVIKMPYPIKRYSRKKANAPFINVLKRSLEQFISGLPKSHRFPAENIFYFWYVYPNSKAKKGGFPDNDNYLVKPIIDIICLMLGIRDIGTDAFLFYATKICSEISEGAYVFIVPQSDCMHDFRSFKNVYRFLKILQV